MKTLFSFRFFILTSTLSMSLLGSCTSNAPLATKIVAKKPQIEALDFETFRSQLYQEAKSGIYIVDGDIPISSEIELRAFHANRSKVQSHLVINQVNGVDDFWSEQVKHELTYCISEDFGVHYEAVRSAMEMAANAWMNAGDVSFSHLSDEDSNCNAHNPRVLFDVSLASSEAPYSARAFFPRSPRIQRNILINPNSLRSSRRLLESLLAHELGHALGFRHEHIRPESEGECSENPNWRAITQYDAASIMHYSLVRCGGNGTRALTLSDKDIDGIATIYGQASFCGDGLVESSTLTGRFEQCDDGNKVNGDGCRNDCTLEICGDGVKDPQEACDDGNTKDDDECRTNCTIPRCGDLILDAGEECERHHPDNEYECSVLCTYIICGDGVRDSEEACDDGNTLAGDGCSSDCTLEYCGDGLLNVGEECEPEHPSNEGTCRANCTYAVCGDGIRDSNEACDDANANDQDKCRTDCTVPSCGDGIKDRGEICDDGNTENADGCDSSCKVEGCAEGFERNESGECVPPSLELLELDESASCQATGPVNNDSSFVIGLLVLGFISMRRKKSSKS